MSRSKQPLAIKKAEEEEDLIEDVLIDDCNNFVGLKVTYGSTQVTNRCRLTSDQTNDRPIVEIRGDANSFYTLVMVDPDSPSRDKPTEREHLLWLVANIQVGGATFGEEVVPYEGPFPHRWIHRIVFVLFRMKSGRIVKAPEKRTNFNTTEFAAKYELQDVAGVFFNSRRRG
ncbi:hypothetical protein AAZX31_08G249900 [Glycine max]|uniref:Flowering locus T-like protein 9 n=2 Tax=Glycine subgen. Soja TaxID=1462606 RepID=G7Z0A9_SOYBN|nr:flowering locus T-like protein 9 [Glycine max]XP_028247351.1 protein FLOWERING LOCUS T-like [Glycine soja]ACU00122.1 flowering locus T-like protein 9 [Glycine max]KAH1238563.1 Protein FLOWERING LOCUS T [Glycine max]RZB98810.1 Protein FLOWERING LOCUS T [Glycine soja]|eukprot:NP_001276317.1 flowering locus T-like protein 9 [Glycine max]